MSGSGTMWQFSESMCDFGGDDSPNSSIQHGCTVGFFDRQRICFTWEFAFSDFLVLLMEILIPQFSREFSESKQ